MKNVTIALMIIMFLGITVLLGYNSRIQELANQRVKQYEDSLKHVIYINMMIELENDSLITYNDSLIALPPIIKTIYRERYIIIERSDINDLDSIVRSSF